MCFATPYGRLAGPEFDNRCSVRVSAVIGGSYSRTGERELDTRGGLPRGAPATASDAALGGGEGYCGVSGATNPSARSVRASSAMGRTSTHPIRAPGMFEATSTAWFRSPASMT